jgi:hypothetical protein
LALGAAGAVVSPDARGVRQVRQGLVGGRLMGVRITDKAVQRERFIVEGDRVFDTQDGVYYIRERIAVENMNEKLERAASLVEQSGFVDGIGRRIRRLKENV